MLERVRRLRQLIDESGVEAFLVTGIDNVRYLSGFTGSAGVLLIGPDEALLLTDARYTVQAGAEAPGFEVVTVEKTWLELLAELLQNRVYQLLGFEAAHVTHQQFLRMRELLSMVELRPLKDLVERLRLVKDEEEIRAIRQAVGLVDEAFPWIVDRIRAGRSEREIALELEFALRDRGAERMAFEIILASGARSALPHGRPSGKVVEKGDLVLLDCGVVCDGYCSDFTRTVLVGAVPEPWQEEIYQVVLAAQEAGIRMIRTGVLAADVDARVREVIAHHGYGEYFGHSTGHGLGVQVHELPRLGRFSEETLQAGMVVTVEPGIYLPDRGGVRIEDVVVIREDGAEILTLAPKDRLIRV